MVAEPLALNDLDPATLPTSAVSVEKLTKVYKGSGSATMVSTHHRRRMMRMIAFRTCRVGSVAPAMQRIDKRR